MREIVKRETIEANLGAGSTSGATRWSGVSLSQGRLRQLDTA